MFANNFGSYVSEYRYIEDAVCRCWAPVIKILEHVPFDVLDLWNSLSFEVKSNIRSAKWISNYSVDFL